MRVIKPYDLTQVTMQSLVDKGLILSADGNKIWSASIFPKSKVLNILPNTDKDHIITQIEDSLFSKFVVLDKPQQNVYIKLGTGRKYIKSVEIGDYNDSVKRYAQLDKPIDYSGDAKKFMNLPVYDLTLIQELDTSVEMIHRPGVNLADFLPQSRRQMFETLIKHPHIPHPKPLPLPFKHNNKAIIEHIFKWALDKGVKYIYCINEYRPYSMTHEWATPYVYYTIKGSY